MTTKIVEYRVLVTVEDRGEFDEQYLRKALSAGIDMARAEGASTALDDGTTETVGWSVSHVGTKDA